MMRGGGGQRRRLGATLRAFCGALGLGLFLSVWGAERAAAEDVAPLRITLDDARQAASNALMAGRPEDALVLADGVLLGAPDDRIALFVKARALKLLGEKNAALDAAKQAWGASETPREKYFSAMMMAQMRSFAGQNGQAQLWLRRAAQIAPEDQLRAIAIEDFRHVRRITPWRLSLDFFVQPSDNLNNAPTEDTPVPGGTISVTPPLSGLRYGAGVQARRILPVGTRTRLHFTGFARSSKVELSREARQVPGADAGDYSQGVLGGAVTLEGIDAQGERLGRAQVTLLRQWQGGLALADVARLDLSVEQALGERVSLAGRLGFETVVRKDSSTGNAQRREVGVTLSQDMGPGTLSLALDAGETLSAAHNVGRKDGRAQLGYAFARPMKGMLPRMSLTYGNYNYDAPWIGAPNGPARRDQQRAVAVDVLLPSLDYYGFAPEIGLSFTDRNSNYNLYKNRSTDLRFGLKSVF